MNLKALMYLIATIIFVSSSSFVGGVMNAFEFLFWCHLIVLVPVIILWFAMQVFGFGIALSPVLAGFIGGSAIIIGGWLLLIYFGANAVMAFFISHNMPTINAPLDLPVSSWTMIFAYAIFNFFAPSLKTKFFTKQTKSTNGNPNNSSSANDEIIIDAEWSESDSGHRHGHIGHKESK